MHLAFALALGLFYAGDLSPVERAIQHGDARQLSIHLAKIKAAEIQRENLVIQCVASYACDSRMLEAILKAGGDPNAVSKAGDTPLMGAAWKGDPKSVAVLIRFGANVNTRDSDGCTALMDGASTYGQQTVSLLLKAGAAINAQNKRGETALIAAAWQGNLEAVRELVQAGADLTIKDELGETALDKAKNREVGRRPEHDKIVELLDKKTT